MQQSAAGPGVMGPAFQQQQHMALPQGSAQLPPLPLQAPLQHAGSFPPSQHPLPPPQQLLPPLPPAMLRALSNPAALQVRQCKDEQSCPRQVCNNPMQLRLGDSTLTPYCVCNALCCRQRWQPCRTPAARQACLRWVARCRSAQAQRARSSRTAWGRFRAWCGCLPCVVAMGSHPAGPTACCLYAGKLSVMIASEKFRVAMHAELHIEHRVAAGAIPGDRQQRCAADVACSHAEDGVNAVVGAQCCPGATTATCSRF
jgi:hypothetical protein